VLVQHGVARSVEFWGRWVPTLASSRRVIRRDQRGHGRSQDPGPDLTWTLDAMVEDLRAFLDALELPTVHYVGDSLGGVLGVLLSVSHPERLRSLTLCSTPLRLPPPGHALIPVGQQDWKQVWVDARVYSAGPSKGYKRWLFEQLDRTPAHVLEGITAVLNADLSPILPNIEVPTLLVSPTNSPITSLSDQLEMRALIPGASITIVDAPGHEIYVDRPHECAVAVDQFIHKVESAVTDVREPVGRA
jgi:pimeloyl-ACP methyl ester carboxylesterase